MSASPPPPSKGRLWLNSLLIALAAGIGYAVFSLVGQQPVLITVIGLVAITVVLTPIFYWANSRRARAGTPPQG